MDEANNQFIQLEDQYGAHHYHPLPVVLTHGEGIYLWDDQDKQYIDMMSAYSAVSHGHCHPTLVNTLASQAKTLAVTSRAFYTDKLGSFLEKICQLTQQDMALPMNTGAEAVETAIKAARKWAYTVKGVPQDKAEIIVCDGNFHGRTITIVSMSAEAQYKQDFGPFAAGVTLIPFGDVSALEAAITDNTAAFLVEPIQGEGGIIVPPAGYLKECAKLCKQKNVLLICDEIQTGLGRTGKLLASDYDEVTPDGLILGKALGGGLLPVSMFLARCEVMEVFQPGDHGSTFGGNPLACAVATQALDLLVDDKLIDNAYELGNYLITKLNAFDSPAIKSIRGKGLLIGVEIDPNVASARDVCLALLEKGILSKETHHTVVRLAPPLVITKTQLDEVLLVLEAVLNSFTCD